jgi:hypothetical protein
MEKENLESRLMHYDTQIKSSEKELSILKNNRQSTLDSLNDIINQEQLIRESNCGEHYYLEDGKWSSTRTCQDCGKKI